MAVTLNSQYMRREALPPNYLTSLGILPGSVAEEFFSSYSGPFCSLKTGFMLLDVGSPDSTESLEYSTRIVQSQLGWSDQFLVISDLLANSALVYDSASDKVFNVDFEGGDSMLLAGTLPSDFSSFSEFLDWYFDVKC